MSTFTPFRDFQDRPRVDFRKDLPMVRREWAGDRVCIRFIRSRGDYYRRTQYGFVFGTLAPADHAEHVSVQTKDGPRNIHYTRITTVWNLSRKLPEPV